MQKFDFFVIGAGSGGVRAARIAAAHGAKVGIAEERHLGGTCVNIGCVPKKLMVYAAHFAHDFHLAESFGWSSWHGIHDWRKLIDNKDAEIKRLNGIYESLLSKSGVTIFDGHAHLSGDHEITIGDTHIMADKILVATGGTPTKPDHPGAGEYGMVSDDMFYLDDRPDHITIVGGGYIAVEFASIFRGLGSKVDLLYRGDLFLRGFDVDIRKALAQGLGDHGVNLHWNCEIQDLSKHNNRYRAALTTGPDITTDAVLYATGRRPNSAGLGLEQAGVKLNDTGAIIVDDTYCTHAPHIYAVGDVTNRVNLTPVALNEGHVLADRLFGDDKRCVNYKNIPTGVFSIPPVATVGLSEAEALAAGHQLDIYESRFSPLKNSLDDSGSKTFMKLVVNAKDQVVLGCHMVGEDGPEIIQGLAIALNCGATKKDFDRTIGLHPSTAEEFVTMRQKRPDQRQEKGTNV